MLGLYIPWLGGIRANSEEMAGREIVEHHSGGVGGGQGEAVVGLERKFCHLGSGYEDKTQGELEMVTKENEKWRDTLGSIADGI